jgi:sec-independent protein translocase protein TatA
MIGTTLFIGGLGGPELVIVFLIAVLLFGANKLPKLARSMGEASGEFKKGREKLEDELNELEEESKSGVQETEKSNN